MLQTDEKGVGEVKERLIAQFGRDPVLGISLIAALLSALFVPPSEAYLSYIDVRVLCLLASLMATVAGLGKAGMFDLLVGKLLRLVHDTRSLDAVLIGVCFFSSMFITNDVSLITFVPLTLLILSQKRRVMVLVIVLQTVAANLGSMLTPLGNPQNLYLYGRYHLSTAEFLRIMALPTVLAMLLLLILCLFFVKPEPIAPPVGEAHFRPKAMGLWGAIFCVCLLAVLHVIPYAVSLLVAFGAALLTDRSLLKKVDYSLLLTFLFFFILIGNIQNIPAVSDWISGMIAGRELSAGILLSQVISNVPAAMLLSGFTEAYEPLLLGVNIGGLGTLIASMASVISYKMYAVRQGARPGRYLALFTAINVAFLVILWISAELLCRSM